MPPVPQRGRGPGPDRGDRDAGQRARVEALGRSSASISSSAPLGLVRHTTSYRPRRARRPPRRTSRPSMRGSIRIAGTSTTSAPELAPAGRQPARLRARARDRHPPAVQRARARTTRAAPAARPPGRRPSPPAAVIAGLRRALGDLAERPGRPCAGRGSVPRSTTAAGSPGRARAAISRSATAGRRAHAHVEDERAREGGQRRPVDRALRPCAGSSCAVTNATADASSRWVTGMPAYAGAATPAVTPGTTSKRHAGLAPAPRPPRRRGRTRTDRRPSAARRCVPARACSTSRRLISSWASMRPARLLADVDQLGVGARARRAARGDTSRS